MTDPAHYRRAAAELRRLADRLDEHAAATDPRGRASLTTAVRSVLRLADRLACRHRGTTPAARDAQQAQAIEREIAARVAQVLEQAPDPRETRGAK